MKARELINELTQYGLDEEVVVDTTEGVVNIERVIEGSPRIGLHGTGCRIKFIPVEALLTEEEAERAFGKPRIGWPDLITLSLVWNDAAPGHVLEDTERRVNDWLKGLIAAAKPVLSKEPHA